MPIAGLLLLLGGCGDEEFVRALEGEPLERGVVHILAGADIYPVAVELAATRSARNYGLMDREELGGDEGMLFVFEEDRPGDSGFYMYRTRIPLDIVFADTAGTILKTFTMEPCESPVFQFCSKYAPGVPYRLVLEVNAGYLESRGIGAGDRIVHIR